MSAPCCVLLLLFLLIHSPPVQTRPTTDDQVAERLPHKPILQAGLPANQTTVTGRDVEFICRVSGDPHPHIQWLKHISVNGSHVGPDGVPYVHVLESEDLKTTDREMSVLTLKKVTAEDSGVYTCLVGNSVGFSHRSAWLTVVDADPVKPPEVAVESSSEKDSELSIADFKRLPPMAPQWVMPERMDKQLQAVPAGRTAKFRCQATGNPTPTLHWYKNDKEVRRNQRIGGFIIRDHMGILLMESVGPSDKGNYTCVMENEHGSLKHTYQLDVVDPSPYRPILHAGLLANQTAVTGSVVEFFCRVSGDPHPHIQWLKHITVNGSRVGPDGVPYVRILQTRNMKTTDPEVSVLTLRKVTLEDSGEYTCLAGNSVGFSHGSAWLTVVDVNPVKSS